MHTTITIRADEKLREELEKRAAALGKSLSQVVRDILNDAVAGGSVRERAGRLRGSLELPRRPEEEWRRQLHRRNWRS
ncbi:MAG TPA: ribbon-helix-helix protein, CopG family [Thermoanaerobaculia bacterium]|nr:ribbon-helix-helix protein, CopG family [Thermoanaerobaculia bacterium]